jgi:hypothetical protein
MRRWLADDLARCKADWKFVSYHTPSYDMSYHRGEWGRKDFLPLFRQFGVDFTFTGDSHTYQRFLPLYQPGENDDRPITHIVTAGGGAGLYWIVDAEPYLAVASKTHHYMAVQIDGRTLTARAVTVDGKTIDEFRVTKDAAGRPDENWRGLAMPEEPLAEIGHCLGEEQIALSSVPTRERPGRASFPLTAGGKAMDYEIRLAPACQETYEMDPVRGHCPAGEETTVQVAVRARAKVKAKGGQLRPVLVLECAFEIDGRKGRIQSYPVSVEAPPATAPD